MEFDSLVQVAAVAPAKKRNSKLGPRGCDACPLNKIKGVHKIMGSISGKEILIVAQSPGPEENADRRELVGKSGQFLWGELKRVGIRRSDCDMFNTVKCFPADLTEGSYNSFLKMRNPAAQEIHCCSIHTETLMAQSRARHILILGQVAAKAFLETRSVPKQKIFWSDKYQAKIYLVDHPAFFIRGYGAGARLESFRSTLKQLAAEWQNKEERPGDNFAYLRTQNYILVSTGEQAAKAGRILKGFANKGRRVAADIEYDIIDGVYRVFVVGFCPKPGLSYVFVIDWDAVEQLPKDAKAVWGWAKALLQNASIRKTFHYGCSDFEGLRKAGVTVEGFDWDTYFADYLRNPDEKQYGLDAVVERRFQQFSGYKNIVLKELMEKSTLEIPTSIKNGTPEQQGRWLSKNDQYHLSRLSPETMRLYNGADADCCKRIEIATKNLLPQALINLYIDLSFVLVEMQDNGPYFDRWQHKQLSKLYPHLEAEALDKLRKMVKNPDFNPGSPPQVFKAVYKQFKLVYPLSKGKPNTQRKTLMMLSREHPFPGAVIVWRKLGKAKSTYIDGFYACAKKFLGRMWSKWSATGTATGRLSSSGGDIGGVNLQNIHGDPQIQNMCVSDVRWRRVYNAIKDILEHQPEGDWEVCIEAWVRACMPDLKTYLILDYGQIEVRVAAQLSGDKMLLKDCEDSDIHTTVGVAMTGWEADKIRHDKKTRTLTKNVHFGILFGIARENLYEFIKAMDPDFDGSREMVYEAYDRYFERYKGVGRYIESQRESAEADGFVETIFGLHRTLNISKHHGAFDDDEEFIDESGERHASWRNQAVNTPVQGSAHQLLECGLVNIRRQPEKYKVLGVPCMDVHDALYMMVNVLELVEAYRKARYLLEKESLATVKSDFPDIKWKVPVVVEAEAGLRLGGRVPLEDDKFTIGGFLLAWYFVTKKQIIDLHKQVKAIPDKDAA